MRMLRTGWSNAGLWTALFLVLAAGTASAIQIRRPNASIPDGVAVPVTLAALKNGFRLCSRPGPSSVTSYWQVPRDDVQRVDRALLAYLKNVHSKTTIAYRPEKFVRQYAGFRRGKEPFIYINAFPSDHLAMSKDDPSQSLWIGCDGGDIFWGIEYDVQRGTFAEMKTNVVFDSPGK
jgi:hypothetical protein